MKITTPFGTGRRSRRRGWVLFSMLAMSLGVPAVVFGGPPWITVEYPPNPHDPASRGALVVVHTYHHASSVGTELAAVAEGIVAGQRRSLDLEVSPTSRPGVYAVRGGLPAEGAWVLVLTMTRGNSKASALVAMQPGGELTAIRVPHRMQGRWAIPHAATPEEVEALLSRAQAVARVAPEERVGVRPASIGALLLAGLGAAALLPLRISRRR